MAAFFDMEKFKQGLNRFPSSFNIDLKYLTKDRIQSTSKKLDDDRKNATKSKDEDIKITNFLSFLYFLLDDQEHALRLVDESLQKDPDNIIANANKARIVLENGEVSEVEEIISKLHELEKLNDYEKRKCYAEAELAYAYSRSGPWYHQRAVEIYSRIVDIYPTEYSWQFGLGLALLRRIHRFISRTDKKFDQVQNENTTVHVAELMLTVAERSDDPILCANAYAKLGRVLDSIAKNKYRDVPERIRMLDIKTCFENALECSPEEPSVLQDYGQVLRYKNDLDKSEKLLRKSLEINPTFLGYHQLALTLKKRVQTSRGQSIEHGDFKSGNMQESRGTFVSRENRRSKNDNSVEQSNVDFRHKQESMATFENRSENWRDQQANWRSKNDHDTKQGYLEWGHKQDSRATFKNRRENWRDHQANWRSKNDRDTEQGYLEFGQKQTSRTKLVNREGNWQDQQANWWQKSDGLSEEKWCFNQDKYRHSPRTFNARSQAIRHENSNRLLHSSYRDYLNENGARNYKRDASGNVTHYDGEDGNVDGRWRKESEMNVQKGRCHLGKVSTGPGGVWRPTGNISKERRSSDYVTKLSHINCRKQIRSPLKVQVDSGNKLLVEAIELLEKAEELQDHPSNMHYDKGILYRMLGQTRKAVEVFKQIVSKRKYLPTQTLLTNAYEQLGVCLLELSESKETPSEIKQKHRKDGQMYLSRALQIQFEIVANDPQFKEKSYSTLKELMNDKRNGKSQELIVLCMHMRDHMDNIDNFNDLFMTEECKLVPDDSIAMLQGYMKAGQLEDCVTLLCSLECTTMFARLPESLVFEVYIKGAFQAYLTDNVQLAYTRFRRAFHVYGMFGKVSYKTEADEGEDTEEVLILHSCSLGLICRLPRDIGTILEDCTGLRYTINTDNVLGNAITTEAMVTLMKKIPCIIIMTHDSEEKYDQLYVNNALQMSSVKNGPQVVVVSNDEYNVPDIARTRGVPFIPMPPLLYDAVRQNDQIPDEHQEWVKQFIEKLKPNQPISADEVQ